MCLSSFCWLDKDRQGCDLKTNYYRQGRSLILQKANKDRAEAEAWNAIELIVLCFLFHFVYAGCELWVGNGGVGEGSMACCSKLESFFFVLCGVRASMPVFGWLRKLRKISADARNAANATISKIRLIRMLGKDLKLKVLRD